jgi:uncharacterized membrane protein
MSNVTPSTKAADKSSRPIPRPFRRAILRGLGIVMPPLLTIVFFLWVWGTIDGYVLQPIESGIGQTMVFFSMRTGVKSGIPADAEPDKIWVIDRTNERVPTETVLRWAGSPQSVLNRARSRGWTVVSFEYDGVVYVPLADRKWIPEEVHEAVKENPGRLIVSAATAPEVYERYVMVRYLPRWRTIPVFLVLFIGILYLLGKFLAAGMGRIVVTGIEALITRVPIVRNVYSSVKQVTDFIFSEREIEFNRVVAVEYPRAGIWAIGFVTGESMLDIRSAANEPVLSVLVPTSPMPATGFTVSVRKSETIDLDITVDQAVQYLVSCGVVVPRHQQSRDAISAQLSTALAQRLSDESVRNDGRLRAEADDEGSGDRLVSDPLEPKARDLAEPAGPSGREPEEPV